MKREKKAITTTLKKQRGSLPTKLLTKSDSNRKGDQRLTRTKDSRRDDHLPVEINREDSSAVHPARLEGRRRRGSYTLRDQKWRKTHTPLSGRISLNGPTQPNEWIQLGL